MAEQEAPSREKSAMDYPEHYRTYDGFLRLTELVVAHVVTVLLVLVMIGFGGATGFWLGLFALFLAVVSAGIGIAQKGNWKPAAWVLGLTAILTLFTIT
jgi:hypothetical protein